MLRFEFITDQKQFLDLETAWKKLSHDSSTPYQLFQDWHWIHDWWENFASRGHSELKILVATQDNTVVLIWPWVITQQAGLRILSPTGGLFSCFDDALIIDCTETRKILNEAWAFILENASVDAVELRAVHESANIAPLIRTVGGDPVAVTSAPVVDLHGFDNFDAYLASRSKKMRQNQRRSLKYLSKQGSVRGSGDDASMPIELAIDTCLSFKSQWLSARGLSGKTLVTDEARVFLIQVCNHFRKLPGTANLCISSLYLDEVPISVGIGFRYHNYHYEYLGGFDYRFEQFGPGRLRMEYGLRDCFENKVSGYNMLTPDTSFKRIWTETAPAVEQYVIPVTIKGRLYRNLYMRMLRPKLKQAYNALPATFKTRLDKSKIWG